MWYLIIHTLIWYTYYYLLELYKLTTVIGVNSGECNLTEDGKLRPLWDYMFHMRPFVFWAEDTNLLHIIIAWQVYRGKPYKRESFQALKK